MTYGIDIEFYEYQNDLVTIRYFRDILYRTILLVLHGIKILADTHVHFWGHWYPCFGFLVTSPLGFKAGVGSALFPFCGGECNVHSLISASGATLANLLAAGTQPVLSPHTVAEVRLPGFKLVLSEYL